MGECNTILSAYTLNSIALTDWYWHFVQIFSMPIHSIELSLKPVNPLLHKYKFWCINNKQLLKTLWETKKLLVTMFSPHSDDCTPFVHIFDIILLFAAELEEPKIDIWGKGLN